MQAVDQLQQGIVEHPWRAGLYAFMVCVVVFALVLGLDRLLRPDSFPVKRVSFEGEFQNVQEQALSAAVVDSARGNFFLLNLDTIRARAVQTPWVHQVTVRRQWPDGIHIRFTEQELVARWGTQAWVNQHGETVHLRGAPGVEGLPRLSGPEGTSARMLEHYRRLEALLAPAGLRISALTLTPRHSWLVALSNGMSLVLGREEPEPKIERFVRMYPTVVAPQQARIKRIDLRYTNGFAVEWDGRLAPPRAAEPIATGVKEG